MGFIQLKGSMFKKEKRTLPKCIAILVTAVLLNY